LLFEQGLKLCPEAIANANLRPDLERIPQHDLDAAETSMLRAMAFSIVEQAFGRQRRLEARRLQALQGIAVRLQVSHAGALAATQLVLVSKDGRDAHAMHRP
jgi:hypothetical protein